MRRPDRSCRSRAAGAHTHMRCARSNGRVSITAHMCASIAVQEGTHTHERTYVRWITFCVINGDIACTALYCCRS